ncbi:DUF1572 family protein [Cyclobacterium qasimii]|uniref:DUF1572 domain-containing protein n=2 Tax=Cyclobacterium qasimii TaxID=1350429 RepID=S7WXH1_9BACT|nr:DUF1572 family protein [Cyclobacterium qasimii]EPR68653.1 hypothetical protein ADICYQ_2350 [Cyclobacterium qasimii M12-11B]GEO23531.1 hypothetical protein CQA01_40650 [Cyclobacterium qasimii]
MKSHPQVFLESSLHLFTYYKTLGEKALHQIPEEKLFWQFNEDSNSAAMIVKHLSGNMLSRWTDFLTADGEKPWRNRDAEFDNDFKNREELMKAWEIGWSTLFQALEGCDETDFDKKVYIRNQSHSLIEAISRQLTHYSTHVGQLIYLSKMLHLGSWESLSIPKGESKSFNKERFDQPKNDGKFSDDYLKKDGK